MTEKITRAAHLPLMFSFHTAAAAAARAVSAGEKAYLTCQPEYAYGQQAMGPIPANAVLQVGLRFVWRAAARRNFQTEPHLLAHSRSPRLASLPASATV